MTDVLPRRRLQLTETVEWNSMTWLVGIGFDRAGIAKEAFVKPAPKKGFKSGSQVEALADDCCIVLSKLLQRGERVQDLIPALFPLGADTGRAAPSLLAAIVRTAARIEREDGDAIQMVYQAKS